MLTYKNPMRKGNPNNQYAFRMMDVASGEGFGTQSSVIKNQRHVRIHLSTKSQLNLVGLSGVCLQASRMCLGLYQSRNGETFSSLGLGGNAVELAEKGKEIKEYLYKHSYEKLAEGNQFVFEKVAPALRFYNQYGLEKLKCCAYQAKEEIDPKLIHGLELIERGDVIKGNKSILEYEQEDILQKTLYDDSKFDWTLWFNQLGYQYWIGRPFGARELLLVFSSACEGEPKVVFDGWDLADLEEREVFAKRTLDAFNQLVAEDNGQYINQQLEQIKQQGY